MKIVKLRAIVSLLLFITFIIVFLTGLKLYLINPQLARLRLHGPNGFGKIALKNVHTYVGFLMSGLVIVHLFLNFKLWVCEWKKLFD